MKTLRIEKPCNVHFQCLRMFLWSVKKPWKERASQKGHKCAWGHLRPPATVKPWNDYSWINEPKQDQQTGPAKPSPNYRTLVIILTSRNDYKKYTGAPQSCDTGTTYYILGKYKILYTSDLGYSTSKTKKIVQGFRQKEWIKERCQWKWWRKEL